MSVRKEQLINNMQMYQREDSTGVGDGGNKISILINAPNRMKNKEMSKSRQGYSMTKSESSQKFVHAPEKFSKQTIMDLTLKHTFKKGHPVSATPGPLYNVKLDSTHPKPPAWTMGYKYEQSYRKEELPEIPNTLAAHMEKHKSIDSKASKALRGIVSFQKMHGRSQFEEDPNQAKDKKHYQNYTEIGIEKSQVINTKHLQSGILNSSHRSSFRNKSQGKGKEPFADQIARDLFNERGKKKLDGNIYDVDWTLVKPSQPICKFKFGDYEGPFKKLTITTAKVTPRLGTMKRKKRPT